MRKTPSHRSKLNTARVLVRSGSFQAETASLQCTPCAPGTFSPRKGSTACQYCAVGGYCEEVGASSASVFKLCPAGTWSGTIGLNNSNGCHSCGVGTYQPITGASSSGFCLPCSMGTASSAVGVGACELCAPGKFQPNSKAISCLPCEDDHLGVYCPNAGTSTPTPCPGGTYSNETGLYSEVQCSSVETGFYASTGSKYPELCPASGFTCPGRALDDVNNPPGSKPILVVSGQASVDVQMETVTFALEVDMHPNEYDEAVVIAELAALYRVSEELISVEVAPISNRRKLSNDTATASGAAQRLRLTVTILVPEDFVDGMVDSLDTESSLTAADGASSSPDAGGLVTSTAAGRLANRLATVNSAEGSSLSAALGFNVTLTQAVLVEMVSRQISASCAPGYWCSAANAIPCVPNTFSRRSTR